MARLSTLAFAAAALSSLAGCALILGSFTTDGTVIGGDGGPDSRVDGATDAGDGGGPKLLVCSLDGVPHKMTSGLDIQDNPLAVHSVNGNGSDRRIAYLVSPNAKPRRMEVADVRNDGTNFSPLASSFTQTIEYIGFDNFEGGLAFIGWDNQAVTLSGSFLLDNDKTMSPPQAIATNPPLPNAAGNFNTAIVPLDLTNGIFFVAVSFSVNNQPQQDMYAGTVKLGQGSPLPPLEKVQSFNARPEFNSSGVLLDRVNRKAAILIGADKGLGDAQVLTIDFSAAPKGLGLRPLPGLGGSHVLGSFVAPSVAAPGTNGVGFLTGDLVNTSVPFGMHAGTIADDKITSFVVTDMPPLVPFATVDDLAIDKATFEWRFFQGFGPQLLVAGRKTGSGDGVNLVWLDGKGNMRAKASGATALFPTEKVSGAGATFRGTPTAVFATLSVIWRTEAHDVMLADVTCK